MERQKLQYHIVKVGDDGFGYIAFSVDHSRPEEYLPEVEKELARKKYAGQVCSICSCAMGRPGTVTWSHASMARSLRRRPGACQILLRHPALQRQQPPIGRKRIIWATAFSPMRNRHLFLAKRCATCVTWGMMSPACRSRK